MSNKKSISLTEILANHADQLLKQQNENQDFSELYPENKELPSLLHLADEVKLALQPVKPEDAFKQKLQQELITIARLKQAEKEKFLADQSTQTSLFNSAVIGGFIALTCLYFFNYRRKQ